MRSIITTFLLTAIQIYRTAGKLLGISSPCRFYPSCSVYGRQVIRRHGPFIGSRMTASRLLRCHPFNPGGIDLPKTETP